MPQDRYRARPAELDALLEESLAAVDLDLTPEQRELLENFEKTFVGDGARRHSPKSSTFFDGVKGFWDRMVS